MGGFKEEVFLIKGRYYTGNSIYGDFPFVIFGAVEGSLIIDETDWLSYSGFPVAPDVYIMRHGQKWGLFPLVSASGGSSVHASVDDKPFVYNDYRFSENYMGAGKPMECGFVFLKKDEQWGLFMVENHDSKFAAGERIKEYLPFNYERFEAIYEVACQKFGATIPLKTEFRIRDEDCWEFDVNEDFLRGFDRPNSSERIMEMAAGHGYYKLVGKDTLYAAARRNPYALTLIGRKLYDDVKKEIAEATEPSEEKDRDLTAKLKCSEEYLNLATTAAKAEGNEELGFIISNLLAEVTNLLRDQGGDSMSFATSFYFMPGVSFKDKNGRKTSPHEYALKLDRHTIFEIDGTWYTYDSIFALGKMGEEYKARYKGNVKTASKLVFYMLNDCNVSGLCVAEHDGKYGVFPLKERTGQQSGVWCCEGEPFLYEAVSVYADWQRWDDYGYVAAKKDGKWGAFKITQFPEPSSELVEDFVHPGPDEAIRATGEEYIPDTKPYSMEV